MTGSSTYQKHTEFRDNVVAPILKEAETEPLILHRVFALIMAVDAYAAQIFQAKSALGVQIEWPPDLKKEKHDDSDYREALALKNDDFRLLRDTAKAAKHVVLTRGNPETRKVTSADQVAKKSLGYGQGGYGEGPYGGGAQIVVTANDGKIRNVSALCRKALAFLDES